MATIIRRLAVFTLIMALFAIAFATLAVNPQRSFHRANVGATLACMNAVGTSCPTAL